MYKYTGHVISDFFYPETIATYSQEKILSASYGGEVVNSYTSQI